MKEVIAWLDGKKTYIFNIAVIVYAVLAYFGMVPSIDEVAAGLVVVVGNAITFRSAIAKAFTDYTE